MEGYLALHDATADEWWLTAAVQAADYVESWNYCVQVPMVANDDAVTYPRAATTTSLSLIATGQSGADVFLAGAVFLYYRLYLTTGDAHYWDFARQLLHDTKQHVDIGGSLGYRHPGVVSRRQYVERARGSARTRSQSLGFLG